MKDIAIPTIVKNVALPYAVMFTPFEENAFAGAATIAGDDPILTNLEIPCGGRLASVLGGVLYRWKTGRAAPVLQGLRIGPSRGKTHLAGKAG